jgi:DNA-binding response OmpR family regulator
MPKPGTKILIIDYEPSSIKQLSDPLTNAGYEVVVAKDGISGIGSFESEKPAMVLLEAMLPKRHGFEVCQELKGSEHGRHTPVVIVTSVYKGRKYRNQALHQHKADEYLEKPVAPEVLLRIVDRLLARAKAPETPAGPASTGKPATPAGSGPSSSSPDTVETEIIERLDEILGEGTGGDPV